MKFHTFKSSVNGQFYFRLVGRNGRIVAASEGYLHRYVMTRTISRIMSDLLEMAEKPWSKCVIDDGVI